MTTAWMLSPYPRIPSQLLGSNDPPTPQLSFRVPKSKHTSALDPLSQLLPANVEQLFFGLIHMTLSGNITAPSFTGPSSDHPDLKSQPDVTQAPKFNAKKNLATSTTMRFRENRPLACVG